MIINLIAGLITMMLHKSESRDINVKVDLSYYETKADLKNATINDTSKLAPKSDLVSLKAEVDQLHIEKLVTVPVD